MAAASSSISSTRKQFHHAVKEGDLGEVRRLVLEQGADVEVLNRLGQTPLHVAALEGRRCIARFLVRAGMARLDAQTPGGKIPFELAVSAGQFAALRSFGYQELYRSGRSAHVDMARLSTKYSIAAFRSPRAEEEDPTYSTIFHSRTFLKAGDVEWGWPWKFSRRLPDAIRQYEEALARFQEAEADGPMIASVLYRLGRCHCETKDKSEEARRASYTKGAWYFNESLSIWNKLSEEIPPHHHADLLRGLGDAHYKLKQIDKALTYYNTALLMYAEVSVSNHDAQIDLAATTLSIASCYEKKGDHQKHFAFCLQHLLVQAELFFGPPDSDLSVSLHLLSNACTRLGYHDRSQECIVTSRALDQLAKPHEPAKREAFDQQLKEIIAWCNSMKDKCGDSRKTEKSQ